MGLFIQREFRTSSIHVYLWTLALIDNSFLVLHIFEDTIKDLDYNQIQLLNIIDKYELACRLINYFKYVARFISAYIILLFSIQRLYIVYRPLSPRFKTKASAWNAILIISLMGFLLNGFYVFMFKITDSNYCDINKKFKREYFYTNIVFFVVSVLLPISFVFIVNIFIIYKTIKNERKMKKERRIIPHANQNNSRNASVNQSSVNNASTEQNSTMITNFQIKPHYLTFDQILNRKTKNALNYSKKVTVLLLLISYSFVILHLPFVLTWSFYYIEITFQQNSITTQYYVLVLLQFSEIFFVLNSGIKFYLYCTSCIIFRKISRT